MSYPLPIIMNKRKLRKKIVYRNNNISFIFFKMRCLNFFTKQWCTLFYCTGNLFERDKTFFYYFKIKPNKVQTVKSTFYE